MSCNIQEEIKKINEQSQKIADIRKDIIKSMENL